MTLHYGPNTAKVERFNFQIENMTIEQMDIVITSYAVAGGVAGGVAAANAAYNVAAIAEGAEGVYPIHWYFGRAAAALTKTHLIGKHGFTQTHFDLLTEPVRLLESFQMTLTYGPNAVKVEHFIEQITKLTLMQLGVDAYVAFSINAAAYDAADIANGYYDSSDAERFSNDAAVAASNAAAAYAYAIHASYDAAAAFDAAAVSNLVHVRSAYFARAAYALAIEHLISTNGFTQEHFDRLTKPVRFLNSFPFLNSFEVEKRSGLGYPYSY